MKKTESIVPIIIWALIVALHIGYLTFQMVNRRLYLADSYEYIAEAENIMTHGTMYAGDLNEPIKPELYTLRPPLYPLLLLITKFFFNSFLPVIDIQTILSLLSIFLLVKILRLFKVNGYALPIIFAALLVTPSQLIYANLYMSELLLQSFLLLGFYFLFKFLIKEQNALYIISIAALSPACSPNPLSTYSPFPTFYFSDTLHGDTDESFFPYSD